MENCLGAEVAELEPAAGEGEINSIFSRERARRWACNLRMAHSSRRNAARYATSRSVEISGSMSTINAKNRAAAAAQRSQAGRPPPQLAIAILRLGRCFLAGLAEHADVHDVDRAGAFIHMSAHFHVMALMTFQDLRVLNV